MIQRIVDFALNNRLLVLAFAALLMLGGMVAFHRLPVDAYPDVADNYVKGRSSAKRPVWLPAVFFLFG